MNERTGWDRRLSVTADGKGLVGHAGALLLHKLADRVGLTEALGRLWPTGQSPTWRDRAHVLVTLAAAIACGARSLLEAERLQAHHTALFGAAPSDSTTHRTLAGLDEQILARIARTRAKARRRLWQLLHLRPGGFPWLTVAGKRLRGWIVIDATIITSASDKNGATVTFKKTYGTVTTYNRGSKKCVFLRVNRTWKRIPEITELRVDLLAGDESKTVIAYPKDWKGRTSPSLGVNATFNRGFAHVVADVWLDKSATSGTRYGSQLIIRHAF